MKSKLAKPKARRPDGLTPEGWRFLVSLLAIAGYRPVDENGDFIVREALQEDFFLALEPKALPVAKLNEPEREARERTYVKIRARLQRIRPDHPHPTLTEETLKALSNLKGLRDPALLDRRDAYELLRQVTSESDPYRIDYLRFCRRLTVSEAAGLLPPPTARQENLSNSSREAAVLKEQPPTGTGAVMYLGGVIFSISKSFGTLHLIPEAGGLRLLYVPIENGKERTDLPGYLNLQLPLDAIGGLLGAAIAFYDAKLALDENVILQAGNANEHDTLIKLYRDKAQGPDGQLSGKETCWLRLVTGATEMHRRRMLLTPRDLISFIEACRLTTILSASAGTHKPRPLSAFTIQRTLNPTLTAELESHQEKHPNT